MVRFIVVLIFSNLNYLAIRHTYNITVCCLYMWVLSNDFCVFVLHVCSIWGLEVNIEKTKVFIFRKRGNIRACEDFCFNEQNIEIMDNFTYLGLVFNYTGSFDLNNQCLIGKASKAQHVLLNNVI